MSYLEEMQKQFKESQEKWNLIGDLSKKLREDLDNEDVSHGEIIRSTAELLLLISEQLQPINSTKDLKEILEMFTGSKV